MTKEQREEYRMYCAMHDKDGATMELWAYDHFLDKRVKVVKGRKVPHGTEGVAFWVGMRNYSGEWFMWQAIIGFKDDAGEVYFTNSKNLEVVE
jgi:hypothetical protein